MNPTPTELFMFFGQTIQDTVGHRESIAPEQKPLTDDQMKMVELIIKSQFSVWRKHGTSK